MGILETEVRPEKVIDVNSLLDKRNEVLSERLLECCRHSIDMHAAFNQMLVCPECKQIIKCFIDDKAFRNYQKFCLSRHRKFITVSYGNLNVLIFKAYEGYSS